MIRTCAAGVIEGIDNSTMSMGFSGPMLEAIELVDVCLLVPIPQQNGVTVSAQGRLRMHAGFWLITFDLKSRYHHVDIHVTFWT